MRAITVYFNDNDYFDIIGNINKSEKSKSKYIHDAVIEYNKYLESEKIVKEVKTGQADLMKLLKKTYALTRAHFACEGFYTYIDPKDSKIVKEFLYSYREK